jgi:hypothetical protein
MIETPKQSWLRCSGLNYTPEERWLRENIAKLFDLKSPTQSQRDLRNLASYYMMDRPFDTRDVKAKLKAAALKEFGPLPIGLSRPLSTYFDFRSERVENAAGLSLLAVSLCGVLSLLYGDWRIAVAFFVVSAGLFAFLGVIRHH